MRILLPIALASLFAAHSAFAATCDEQAAEKKLAGAAKSSFMKKCETDAVGDAKGGAKGEAKGMAKGEAKVHRASCADQSAEKKLAGAAKDNFMKKCESDAKKK